MTDQLPRDVVKDPAFSRRSNIAKLGVFGFALREEPRFVADAHLSFILSKQISNGYGSARPGE
jgi:hypothetical protein